jgi:hypothetical protein
VRGDDLGHEGCGERIVDDESKAAVVRPSRETEKEQEPESESDASPERSCSRFTPFRREKRPRARRPERLADDCEETTG